MTPEFEELKDDERHLHIKRYYDQEPEIDLWQISHQGNLGQPPVRADGLPTMVEDIVEVLHRMLFSRRPEHWPTIFATLCIFQSVMENFNPRPCLLFSSLKKAGLAMKHVHSVLCHLFELVTNGKHPISDAWDKKHYMTLTKSACSIDAMERFHDLWSEGT